MTAAIKSAFTPAIERLDRSPSHLSEWQEIFSTFGGRGKTTFSVVTRQAMNHHRVTDPSKPHPRSLPAMPVTPDATPAALRTSRLYSEELGIHLREGTDSACFRWFLASLLFGGRISETIAKSTYWTFARYRLLTPRAILRVGWEFLVNPIMREGGYVRYDGRKSTQILRDCETLRDEYGGSLRALHDAAQNRTDLERRLLAFYGVGPVTANIFLRELRPFWPKADPDPLPIVRELAKVFGIDLSRYDRKSLAFTRIEAGLIRLRKTRPRPPR